MKKIIASLIVCAFAVAMVACDGGKKAAEAAKAKADSTAVADSIAMVEAEAAAIAKVKADSTVKADSIAAAVAAATPVKKK